MTALKTIQKGIHYNNDYCQLLLLLEKASIYLFEISKALKIHLLQLQSLWWWMENSWSRVSLDNSY